VDDATATRDDDDDDDDDGGGGGDGVDGDDRGADDITFER